MRIAEQSSSRSMWVGLGVVAWHALVVIVVLVLEAPPRHELELRWRFTRIASVKWREQYRDARRIARQLEQRPHEIEARAASLYRRRRFIEASQVVAAAGTDPSLAELYHQLAVAYPIATSQQHDGAQLDALRQARSLDLVLGGAFADDLEARITRTVPLIAAELALRHDDDLAREAIAYAELFELDDVGASYLERARHLLNDRR